MNELLQNVSWVQAVAATLFAGGGFMAFRDKLPSLPKWGKSAPAAEAIAADDADALDLAAFKRLQARAARTGCAELKAAVKDCGTHFFDVVDTHDRDLVAALQS
jgi:hypothetical protein